MGFLVVPSGRLISAPSAFPLMLNPRSTVAATVGVEGI